MKTISALMLAGAFLISQPAFAGVVVGASNAEEKAPKAKKEKEDKGDKAEKKEEKKEEKKAEKGW